MVWYDNIWYDMIYKVLTLILGCIFWWCDTNPVQWVFVCDCDCVCDVWWGDFKISPMTLKTCSTSCAATKLNRLSRSNYSLVYPVIFWNCALQVKNLPSRAATPNGADPFAKMAS